MKKKENYHRIAKIVAGSIAEEMEIEVGDELVSINGQEIKDVFDYHFLANDEELEVIIKKKNGEIWELDIEKDYNEDLGIIFETNLMDEYRSCSNKCVFCFIDQMPKGMRETLYFKDDDARLSYLQGNYVTLTNMSVEEAKRICLYKLSPINISIHTTNPELRCKMLNNRFAGDKLKLIDLFYESEIEMNGQIVLCKGYNDKLELDRTIGDLIKYLPYLKSVSVVPVGLTDYREGLAKLEPFNKEDAINFLNQVKKWRDKIFAEHGTHMIHASDEWFILAERDFPEEEEYEGYPQIENGVGMSRSLINEVEDELKKLTPDDRIIERSLATGVLASNLIKSLVEKINVKFPNVKIHVYTIVNEFFGKNITVSGLLTGTDLLKQLKGKELGECLLLPSNVLRSGEDTFLDDIHASEFEKALQTKIRIVKSDGKSFVDSIIN